MASFIPLQTGTPASFMETEIFLSAEIKVNLNKYIKMFEAFSQLKVSKVCGFPPVCEGGKRFRMFYIRIIATAAATAPSRRYSSSNSCIKGRGDTYIREPRTAHTFVLPLVVLVGSPVPSIQQRNSRI